MLEMLESEDNWDEAEPERSRTDLRRLIAFTLGEALYGVPITDVAEIRELLPLTPLPPERVPAWVIGLINLRGMILPVIDLQRRFNPAARSEEATAHLVIVKGPGYWVALRVGTVYGLVRMEPSAFRLPPAGTADGEFIAQMGVYEDRLLIELDIQRLLRGTSPGESA